MKKPYCDPRATRRSYPRWSPEYLSAVADFAKRKPRPHRNAECGVYWLFKGQEIVYVGSTINLSARLAGTDHASKDWDSYVLLPCTPEKRVGRERFCIKLLLPPLNNCSFTKRLRRLRDGVKPVKRPRPKQALSEKTMRTVRQLRKLRG